MDLKKKLEEKVKRPSGPLITKLRDYFITGLVATGPLLLTIWIVANLFLFTDSVLGRPIQYFLAEVLNITFFQEQMVRGIGFVALLVVIIGSGWFARQYLGGKAVDWFNSRIDRIPLINKVYNAIVQISEALLGGQKEVFKYAVMIEYPKENVYSIAFVTQDTRGAAQDALSEDSITVFVPTTPNPTSGYMLFIPKKDAAFLDLSVEEALKLIISAGAIVVRSGGGSREAAERLGIRQQPLVRTETRPIPPESE